MANVGWTGGDRHDNDPRGTGIWALFWRMPGGSDCGDRWLEEALQWVSENADGRTWELLVEARSVENLYAKTGARNRRS